MAPLQDEDFLPGLCQVSGCGETIMASAYDNSAIFIHGFDLLRKAFLVILCTKSTHQSSKKRNLAVLFGVSPTALSGALGDCSPML
jgi:hypothetical protein